MRVVGTATKGNDTGKGTGEGANGSVPESEDAAAGEGTMTGTVAVELDAPEIDNFTKCFWIVTPCWSSCKTSTMLVTKARAI